jgi:AraC family transcriptional regulator, regulatory protein of adaptative response / DNA-3-methyladenine glycosylase II
MARVTPNALTLDEDTCYRAVSTRDARFDGWFVTGVRTTGIYCRPSCPAVTPKRRNVVFFCTAAAAQSCGFRACRRCLPDAVPGSPEWNVRADLAARAMRLIGDGVVERDGVPGLAGRLGYSQRHLTRVLTAELGAGPLALARAHRAHAARLLIETTELRMADVAFAAGFASVRQFNDTILAVFGVPPSALRSAALQAAALGSAALGSAALGSAALGRGRHVAPQPGTIALRLPFRRPMDGAGLLAFLCARAVPGVEAGGEAVAGGGYGRTLALPHGPATVWLRIEESYVDTVLRLGDLRDLGAAVSRVRRLTDADADPAGTDEALAVDPSLAPSVLATPGIRVPGAVDGDELVLRAVLGQQVSVAAARTMAGRLAAALGAELPAVWTASPRDKGPTELWRLFPSPAAVAERGAQVLTGPRRRIDTVLAVAAALADGSLQVHAGRDPVELSADLQALPGVGPWTAGYVTMRVLGAPDILLASDLMVRRGAEALGLPSTVDGLQAYSRRWSPWRSYAGMHLWRASSSSRPERRSA